MNFGGAVRVNKCGVFVVVFLVFLFFLYTYQGKDEPLKVKSLHPGTRHMHISGSGSNTIQGDPNKISLQRLLIAAVDVAQRGGKEVVAVKNSGPANLGEELKGKTKEGADDRVTQGDFRSHRVMYYGMRKAFPKIKVISEEHTENPDWTDVPIPQLDNEEIANALFTDQNVSADDVAVWIDPLDATQEYTENLLEYVTVMVCVAVKGVPIIGVIHRPFTDETYWSIVGHANSANLDEMVKNRQEDAKTLRVIVSRSHAGAAKNLTKHALGSDTPVSVIQAAGAGYKVIEVIADRADVYLHVTAIKKWDLCAGQAILSGVGGTMSTIQGESLDYSADTNPRNIKGTLAYFRATSLIEKLKKIIIAE